MVTIDIIANRKSFFLTKEVSNINLSLSGDLDLFENKEPIAFKIDENIFNILTSHNLNILGKELKGKNDYETIPMISKFVTEKEKLESLTFAGVIEIELIKSLFLIYDSLELIFKSPYDQRIENLVYDQFIIDYTNKPEKQKDIYFIDKSFIKENNLNSLHRLMDLNLLAKLSVCSNNKTYETFYIPLTKPGAKEEEFSVDGDSSGVKTYNLWKDILSFRDAKMRNWINKRY